MRGAAAAPPVGPSLETSESEQFGLVFMRPRISETLVYPECMRKAFSVGCVAKACLFAVAFQ